MFSDQYRKLRKNEKPKLYSKRGNFILYSFRIDYFNPIEQRIIDNDIVSREDVPREILMIEKKRVIPMIKKTWIHKSELEQRYNATRSKIVGRKPKAGTRA